MKVNDKQASALQFSSQLYVSIINNHALIPTRDVNNR